MTLWEIVIEVGSGTPILHRYFYIVGCGEEKRAKQLALTKHTEFYPETKDKSLVAECDKLDQMDIKVGVWFNRKEVFGGSI
jgi:hypothetical protein